MEFFVEYKFVDLIKFSFPRQDSVLPLIGVVRRIHF